MTARDSHARHREEFGPLAVAIGVATLAAFLLMAHAGCARTIQTSVLPPSVVLIIADEGDSGSGGWSQGVWLGDRVLTVLHTFSDDAEPPTEIGVNSRYMDATLLESGDRRLYVALQKAESLAPFHFHEIEDWAVFKVDSSSPFPSEAVTWSSGSPRIGETLYAVGYDGTNPGSGLTTVPLHVVAVQESGPREGQAVIIARHHSSVLGPGWSGSFVGRYVEGDDRWAFHGILISGMERNGQTYANILMPPPSALERFFHQTDGPTASAAPRAGF